MKKRPRESKGWSVFFRPERARWIIAYADEAAADGWSKHTIGAEHGIVKKTQRKQAEVYAAQWVIDNAARPDRILRRRAVAGLSLREVQPKFLELRGKDERIAASTLKGYREQLNSQIVPHLGDQAMAHLGVDYPRLRKFFRELRTRVSASRQRNTFSTLRSVFDDAMAEGWVRLAENPMRNEAVIRELAELDTQRVVQVLPIATVQALVSSEKVNLARRVRYALLFLSAVREGEVSGLTWGNASLDAEIPFVQVLAARQLVRRVEAKLGKTKTPSSRRVIPLNPAAVEALREWKSAVVELLGHEPTATDPIFPSVRGGFARPRMAELLRADLEKLEFEKKIAEKPILMKASRSSAATWMKRAGVDPTVRKRILGHALQDVTEDFYTGDEMREMYDAVCRIGLTWAGGVVREIVQPIVQSAQSGSEGDAEPEDIVEKTSTRRSGRVVEGSGFEKRRDTESGCATDEEEPPSSNKSQPRSGYGSRNGSRHNAIAVPGTTPAWADPEAPEASPFVCGAPIAWERAATYRITGSQIARVA